MSNPFQPPAPRKKPTSAMAPKTVEKTLLDMVLPPRPPKPEGVKVPGAPKQAWQGTVKERGAAPAKPPAGSAADMFTQALKPAVPPQAPKPGPVRMTFPTPQQMEVERAKDMEKMGIARPGLRDANQTVTAKRRRQAETEEYGMAEIDRLMPGLDPGTRYMAKQFMQSELGGSTLGELRRLDGRAVNGSGRKYKDAGEVARRFVQLSRAKKGAEIQKTIGEFMQKRAKTAEIEQKTKQLAFNIRLSAVERNDWAMRYLNPEQRMDIAAMPWGDDVDITGLVWGKISENAKNTVNSALGVPGIRAAEESYKRMAADPNMSPLERGIAGIGAFGTMATGLALSQVGDLAGMAADIPGEVINVATTEVGDPRMYGAMANLVGKAAAVAATAAGAGQGVKLALQPSATLSGKAANVVKGLARIGYEGVGGGPVPESLKNAGEKLAEAVRAADITPEELRSVAEEVSQAVKLDKARVDDFASKIRKGAIDAGADIDDLDAKAAAMIVVAMEAKTKTKALDSVEIRGQRSGGLDGAKGPSDRVDKGLDGSKRVEGEGLRVEEGAPETKPAKPVAAEPAKPDQIPDAGKKVEEMALEPAKMEKEFAPQRVQGRYVYDKNQKRGIVTFYEGADITTAVHEPAHHLLMHLPDKQYKVLLAALKIDPEKENLSKTEYGRLQEFWARGIENTLYDGRVKGAPDEVQDALDWGAKRFRAIYGEAGVPLPDMHVRNMLDEQGRLKYEPVANIMAQMMAGEVKPRRSPPKGVRVSPAEPQNGTGTRMVDINGQRVTLRGKEDEAVYDSIVQPAREAINEISARMREVSDPAERSRMMTEVMILRRNMAEDLDDLEAAMRMRQKIEEGVVEDMDVRFMSLDQKSPKRSEKAPADGNLESVITRQGEGPLPQAEPGARLTHLKTGFSDEPIKLSMSENLKKIFFDDAVRAVTARNALEKSLAADMLTGSSDTLMGTALDISEAINKQARLGHKIEDFVLKGIRGADGERLSNGVLQIRDSLEAAKIDVEKWQWYKRALRENEIYDQGRGGIIDLKRTEINSKFVTEFLNDLTDEQLNDLRSIDDEWQKIADAQLSLFEQYGLRPEGWAEKTREDNQQYFPLFRARDSVEAVMAELNPSKMASPGVTVKMAKGGTVYIDGFAAMAREIEKVIRHGEATQAYLPYFKAAAEQAKKEMANYLEAVKKNPSDPNLQRPTMIQWVEDITPPKSEDKAMRTAAWGGSADLDSFQEAFIEGADPILRLIDNGEERVYKIDPFLWDAIRGGLPASQNLAATAMMAVAKVPRYFTTGPGNPQFQLVFNPMIDGVSASVTQGVTAPGWIRAFYDTLLRGVKDRENPIGLKQKIGNQLVKIRNGTYDEAAMAGVFTNSKGTADYLPDEWLFDPSKKNQVQKAIEKAAQNRGWRLISTPFELVKFLGQTMEEATKLAAYDKRQGEALKAAAIAGGKRLPKEYAVTNLRAGLKARKQGKKLKDMTPLEIAEVRRAASARSAMDAVSTMNFSRSGELGKWFSKVGIPYAGIPFQVMTAHAKAIQRDPVMYTLRAAAIIGGPSAIEYALYHDDPEWQGMPNYLRHGAVMFRDGILRGEPDEGDWVAIRIPEELGILIRGGMFNTLQGKSPTETVPMITKEEARKFIPSVPTAIALLGQQVYFDVTGGVLDLRFYSQRAYPLQKNASDEAKAKNTYKQVLQQTDTLFGSQGRMAAQYVGYKMGKQEKAPSIWQRFRPQPQNMNPNKALDDALPKSILEDALPKTTLDDVLPKLP